ANDVWTFNQSGKYRDRNSHFVIDRIVIDKQAQFGKHLGNLSVKIGHVVGGLRVIVRHTEKRSITADVLDKLKPLDDFPRIRAGCANEQRDALLYRVNSGHSQSLVLVPMEVVALAKTSGGGDHIDSVIDDSVHTDVVPQLYSNGVVEKAPMSVFFQVFAGKMGQPFESQQPLRPRAADFISLIHLLIKVRNPADVVFGPIDLQPRKSVKDTAQDQLHGFNCAAVMDAMARNALDKIHRPFLAFRLLWILH